jgi:hypothetical protein
MYSALGAMTASLSFTIRTLARYFIAFGNPAGPVQFTAVPGRKAAESGAVNHV